MLAKHEDILIAAVSSLIIYAYDEWQLSNSEQDPYMLNKLNTSNSNDTISLLYRNHQIDATTLIWPPFVIPNNM